MWILLDPCLTEFSSILTMAANSANLPREAKNIKHVWFYPNGLARRISHHNFPAQVRKRLSKPPHEAIIFLGTVVGRSAFCYIYNNNNNNNNNNHFVYPFYRQWANIASRCEKMHGGKSFDVQKKILGRDFDVQKNNFGERFRYSFIRNRFGQCWHVASLSIFWIIVKYEVKFAN